MDWSISDTQLQKQPQPVTPIVQPSPEALDIFAVRFAYPPPTLILVVEREKTIDIASSDELFAGP